MSGESYTKWRNEVSDDEEQDDEDEEEEEGVGVGVGDGGGSSRVGRRKRGRAYEHGVVTLVTNGKPRPTAQPRILAPAAQTRMITVMVLVCVLCAAAGVWIGFVWGSKVSANHPPINLIIPAPRSDYNHSQRFLSHLDPAMIEAYMRKVSELPRAALGTVIEGIWKQQGYDITHTTFTVDVPRPDPHKPNTVEVVYTNGTRWLLNPEPPSLQTPPFSIYSPTGVVSGRLVFGHYGRRQDLTILQSRKILHKGCILLLRHGIINTAAKVRNAAQAGAAAVLVFPDPDDTQDAATFPLGTGLPGDGLIWESVATIPGDPATPHTPSLPHVYRQPKEQQPAIPQIPVQPISADSAREIFNLISGPDVPQGWSGGLDAPYTLGGSWQGDYDILNITVSVRNIIKREELRNIHATMPASDESRVVMVGCRYGSPQGQGHDVAGVGALLAMSDAVAKSHLPRGTQRRVVFSAWAMGQEGSLGATEFTQLHSWWIESSVLGYLGLDNLLEGTGRLRVAASPALREAIREAARQVSWPRARRQAATGEEHSESVSVSVREGWRLSDPVPVERDDDVHFYNLGSGSDAVSFTAQRGVPSATFTSTGSSGNRTYSLQDSQYDTLDVFLEYLDPDLSWTHMLTSLVGATLLVLTESEVPPLQLSDLGGDLYKAWVAFTNTHSQVLHQSGHNFTGILDAIESEILTLVDSLTVLDAWYMTRPFYVRPYPQHYPGEDHRRQVEKRLWWLANLERGLLGPRGVGRSFTANLMLGPDPENPDQPQYFPHISTAITRALHQTTPWATVHQELSLVLSSLTSYRLLFPSDMTGDGTEYSLG